MAKVKVSILVPIYNVEKYLKQCLDSLVGQTLKDIQIICINDGSTDSSADIINSFAKKDDRFLVITKKNSGYGDSMNQGLSKATGEYVGILESDDYIETDAFEKLYKLAKEYDADVVRANYYHFKDNKNKKYSYVNELDTNRVVDPSRRTWIFYQAPAIWSAIYRNDFLKKNKIKFLPTPGASYQDTGFNFKVWATTKKAVFTSEAYLHYRLDNESSSVNNPGKVFCVCEEYAEIEKYLRSNNLYDKFGEIMQMTKFGAYNWNLYRLAPDLRKDFIARIKEEFSKARKENTLNKSLFLNPDQWTLLNYILDHSIDESVKYVNSSNNKMSAKMRIKKGIKKIYKKINPSYRKQLEISELIKEILEENAELKEKIKLLERRLGDKK